MDNKNIVRLLFLTFLSTIAIGYIYNLLIKETTMVEIFSLFANLLIGIGTILLGYVAWKGLNTWKKQRKSELAEEIIYQF